LNCLHNSPAVAGLRLLGEGGAAHLGLVGEGIAPGEFFFLLGFAGGRSVCDDGGALAGGLASRVLEFGAEPTDQAAFFFPGTLGVQGDQPAEDSFLGQIGGPPVRMGRLLACCPRPCRLNWRVDGV